MKPNERGDISGIIWLKRRDGKQEAVLKMTKEVGRRIEQAGDEVIELLAQRCHNPFEAHVVLQQCLAALRDYYEMGEAHYSDHLPI
jgi:hypothetical protein